jgi:hypothetical protein
MKKGTPIPLDPDEKQDVELLEAAQTGLDAQVLNNQILTDWAAGGLSDQAISGTPPPGGLSAAALRLLGSNIGERSRPFLKPVESSLLGCLEALIAQYETGSYLPLRVSGKTTANQAFDREITPEAIAGHGTLSLKLLQELPEDDQLKWATAQMATNKNAEGNALLSMQSGREKLLGIQDSGLEEDRLRVEKAKALLPVLTLIDMMEACIKRGEMQYAAYLKFKIDMMIAMEMQPPAAPAAPPGKNGAGGAQSEPKGVPAQVSSVENSQPGTTGAQPSPTAGQNTAQPRNGREEALNSIGLMGAGSPGV